MSGSTLARARAQAKASGLRLGHEFGRFAAQSNGGNTHAQCSHCGVYVYLYSDGDGVTRTTLRPCPGKQASLLDSEAG
jgi:hypothetical protein